MYAKMEINLDKNIFELLSFLSEKYEIETKYSLRMLSLSFNKVTILFNN